MYSCHSIQECCNVLRNEVESKIVLLVPGARPILL